MLPTIRELIVFDLTVGARCALAELRQHLPARTVAVVMLRYLRECLRDPLSAVPRSGWCQQREALVRHQLRSAVRFDNALSKVAFEKGKKDRILTDVIVATGAAFIEYSVALPSPQQWGALSRQAQVEQTRTMIGQFFNARTERIEAYSDRLAFDVTACRFVELCRAIDRPYLAPLFCAADSARFGRAASPVRLERTGTIATGASHCDFRFRFVSLRKADDAR